jgi:cation transport ATPase
MRGELSQLIDFLDLAKTVRGKVRQNLILTVLYNAICIPIAITGILSPPIAVCVMLLSSLGVIGNTLLLARKP